MMIINTHRLALARSRSTKVLTVESINSFFFTYTKFHRLQARGMLKSGKRASKVAASGFVALSVLEDGKKASLVEVNCETDFTARTQEFVDLVTAVSKNPGAKESEAAVQDLSARTGRRNRILLNTN